MQQLLTIFNFEVESWIPCVDKTRQKNKHPPPLPPYFWTILYLPPLPRPRVTSHPPCSSPLLPTRGRREEWHRYKRALLSLELVANNHPPIRGTKAHRVPVKRYYDESATVARSRMDIRLIGFNVVRKKSEGIVRAVNNGEQRVFLETVPLIFSRRIIRKFIIKILLGGGYSWALSLFLSLRLDLVDSRIFV